MSTKREEQVPAKRHGKVKQPLKKRDDSDDDDDAAATEVLNKSMTMKHVMSNFVSLKQAQEDGKGDCLIYINNPMKITEATTKAKGVDCTGKSVCISAWGHEDREAV